MLAKLFRRSVEQNGRELEEPRIHVRRNGTLHVDTGELLRSKKGREALERMRRVKVREAAARHQMRRAR